LTLLEVLLATAVFALSLVAIGQLINQSSDQAVEVQEKSRGARLAQSKLAEYASGVRSLSGGGSSGDFEMEGEPDWSYESTVEADASAAGLYKVTVTASKGDIKTSLSQWVFDPKMRGVILGTQAQSTTTTTTNSSSTTTTTPSTTPTTPTTPTTNTMPQQGGNR
jgi:type II secretion system protein I